MKMKKNHKRIILLLALIVVVASCFAFNSVEAAITTAIGGKVTVAENTSSSSAIANGIVDIISYVGGMAASGVFATITAFINVLSVAMFLILEAVMVLGTGDITHIPMPDTIVFNRFAFFDPNFVNPATGSLTGGFASVLRDVFASFQTIAIAIFVIAAMVTGLRLALSSVAAKKAQYKEAAMKWITGFVILICLRWILAGIFYINEQIVAELYKLTVNANDLKIPVYVTTAIPIFGQPITDLIKLLEDFTGWDLAWNVSGYLGIVLANLAKSMGGDIISSIVGFILMGQTLTIVGSYLKRVFMCIILGIVSPLIVATDTITSVQGKQSTIFKNWLKNFTLTVFMQSLHALYMVVVLQILALLYGSHTTGFAGQLTSAQVSIITIVLTTGLVKLEKMIKGMFGIGDSFAGDLKDGGKSMMKAMGALKGAGAAVSALKDNVPKMKEASKRKQAYGSELNRLKGEQSVDNARSALEAAKKAKAEGNMDEYKKQMQIAWDSRKEAKERGVDWNYATKNGGVSKDNNNNTINNNTTNNNTTGKNTTNNNGDYLQQVLNKNSKNLTREQQIQKLEEGMAKETANYKSARLATVMGPANLAAGIGLGLGIGDDIGETLFKGGMITAALDKGTEVVGHRAADKDRKSFYKHEQEEGAKLGYTPSEKIVREKSTIEQTVTNPKIYINPIEVGREVGKQFKGMGEVLSNTMREELREIDKDLDNN